MTLKNVDYGKIEQRILDRMTLTQRTLFDEARAAVNAAPTPEARKLAKQRFFVYLYGNPQSLLNAIALPVREQS